MEDIMKALLDVVRAQHSATEGSEEKPFDINDIIDMAMNITGRPEEPAEQRELSDTIQKMAEEKRHSSRSQCSQYRHQRQFHSQNRSRYSRKCRQQ